MIKLALFPTTTKADHKAASTMETNQTEPLSEVAYLEQQLKQYRADNQQLELLLLSLMMPLHQSFDRAELVEQWKLTDRLNESMATFPLPDSACDTLKKWVRPFLYEVSELQTEDVNAIGFPF